MFKRLAAWLIARAGKRAPDVEIGGPLRPYLRRWWLIPRNPLFNIYLHQFLRDDDDRALHDHMYFNCSIVLRGRYFEHTIAAGGVRARTERTEGAVVLRSPWLAHRIELPKRRETRTDDEGKRGWVAVAVPCWSLFITGPRLRAWGFHCEREGWVHWRAFTDPETNGRTTGKGCDQ